MAQVQTEYIADGAVTTAKLYNQGSELGTRNFIANGDMQIWQDETNYPNIGATQADMFADGFLYNKSTSGQVTATLVSVPLPAVPTLTNYARFTVTTADTSIAAGDYAYIQQSIYGNTAFYGKYLTLSFWVRSSKTGTYCAAISAVGSNEQTQVKEYTINTANTWEYKTLTTSSVYPPNSNNPSFAIRFTLCAGSSHQISPNTWVTTAGLQLATSNQVNFFDAVSNEFSITGIQLEIGQIATPFQYLPYLQRLAIAKMFRKVFVTPGTGAAIIGVGYATGTTSAFITVNVGSMVSTVTPTVKGTLYVMSAGTGYPVTSISDVRNTETVLQFTAVIGTASLTTNGLVFLSTNGFSSTDKLVCRVS